MRALYQTVSKEGAELYSKALNLTSLSHMESQSLLVTE